MLSDVEEWRGCGVKESAGGKGGDDAWWQDRWLRTTEGCTSDGACSALPAQWTDLDVES